MNKHRVTNYLRRQTVNTLEYYNSKPGVNIKVFKELSVCFKLFSLILLQNTVKNLFATQHTIRLSKLHSLIKNVITFLYWILTYLFAGQEKGEVM